jgi:site-specific DNA-methyltransferase (adenine-specific)
MSSISLDEHSAYEYLTTLPDESAQCVVLRECVYTRLYESLRILRPGGVCLVFSTTKTLNTTFKNLEEAGFIIRDVIAWVNPSVPASSFGMSHLIARSQDLEEMEKEAAMKDMEGLRTMRLRTCFTPIVLAQRPTAKTLVNNQIDNGCGLMNPTRVASGALSANCMTTDFTGSLYDQAFLLRSAPNSRLIDTQPDPLYRIMHHLLETFTHPGNVVVDPQACDGASMCAAISLGRSFLGSEDNPERRAGALKRAARCEAAMLPSADIFPYRIVG